MTYIIYQIPFFFYLIPTAYYTDYRTTEYYTGTLCVHVLFLSVVNLFLKKITNRVRITQFIVLKNNNALFFLSFSVLLFIVVFGQSGDSILSSGGYGKSTVTRFLNLSIYEYYLIFYIIAYKYSNGNKNKIIMINIASIPYILKNLLFGGRIESLQLLLLMFLMYYDYRITYKKIAVFSLIAFYVFDLWGRIRGNPAVLVSGDYSYLMPFNYFTQNSGVLGSHQGDVFHNTVVFFGLFKDGIFDLNYRINSFLCFMVSVFIPNKYLPQEYNLWVFSKSIGIRAGGGGLISGIIFTWLGVFGVILTGVFLAAIINYYNKIISDKRHLHNEYFVIYFMLAITTFPRWFAYSPITLFKLCLYGIVVLFIFRKASYLLRT